MNNYHIYLPLVDDKTRNPFGPDVWYDIESDLLDFAGGFTRLGNVTGVWIDHHGREIADECRVYAVATDRHDAELRHLAKDFGKILGQQCIFVARVGTADLVACS